MTKNMFEIVYRLPDFTEFNCEVPALPRVGDNVFIDASGSAKKVTDVIFSHKADGTFKDILIYLA